MGNKGRKNLIIVITYTVILILFITNFKLILNIIIVAIHLFRPLFIGIAFAFILHIPCSLFESLLEHKLLKYTKKSINRGISICITYILLILVVGLIIRFILPQLIENIQNFINNIGIYLDNLQSLLDKITDNLNIKKIDVSTLGKWIQDSLAKLGSGIDGIVTHIIDITTGVISFLVTVVIGLVFSVYFLAGKEKILFQSKRLIKTYLPIKLYDVSSYVFNITIDVFYKYIVGQLTDACILGTLCFFGMIICGFDYALLISVLILITALIPVVGAFIGGGVAFFLLFMVSPKEAVFFLIFLIILQQFENSIIYPRIVGSKLGLPAVWVLLAITVGGGLFGPLGILLGVPIVTVIYSIIRNDINKRNKPIS